MCPRISGGPSVTPPTVDDMFAVLGRTAISVRNPRLSLSLYIYIYICPKTTPEYPLRRFRVIKVCYQSLLHCFNTAQLAYKDTKSFL